MPRQGVNYGVVGVDSGVIGINSGVVGVAKMPWRHGTRVATMPWHLCYNNAMANAMALV